MRLIVLLALFILSPLFSFAQNNLSCDIHVSVLPGISRDEVLSGEQRISGDVSKINLYKHPVEITQTIHLKEHKGDTLSLYIKNATPFLFIDGIYYQNLTVSYRGEDDAINIIDHCFDGKHLIIPLPAPAETPDITIKYIFYSDFMFRISSGATSYVVRYSYSEHSWYFTSQDMKIRTMDFKYPAEEVWLFPSCIQEKREGSITINPALIDESGVDFYLLSRECFDRQKVEYNDLEVTFYTYKELKVDTVRQEIGGSVELIRRVRPHPREESTKTVTDQFLKTLSSQIGCLMDILGHKEMPEIHIVEAGLWAEDRAKNRIRLGTILKCSDDLQMIFIDSFLLTEPSLPHEIIHTLVDPSKFGRNDYFLSESLVEYLAVYTYYVDPLERNKAFKKKIDYYNEVVSDSPSSAISIFQLEDNFATMDGSRGGSHIIVYQKTPYLIHCLAQEVGEDKFINFLKRYYREIQELDKTDFSDFERMLLERDIISQEAWDRHKAAF